MCLALKIYQKLIFFTFFLTLILVAFGAFVRLTDSGLGCPDWPGCYGKFSPNLASDKILKEEIRMPLGPVTIFKAWTEMIHRYIASVLGILIGAMTIIGFLYKKDICYSPYFVLTIFIIICIQGAFGAWTVIYSLMPIVVSTHLLLGMLTLVLMTILADKESKKLINIKKSNSSKFKFLTSIGILLLFIQIALGGWVSTNYATLACIDFPTCQGSWIPEMNFKEGFSIIHSLGMSASGNFISQVSLTAIHWTHRSFAFFVGTYLSILFYKVSKEPELRKPAKSALLFLTVQFISGISIIFFRSPIFFALLHNSTAMGLIISSTIVLSRLSRDKVFHIRQEEL